MLEVKVVATSFLQRRNFNKPHESKKIPSELEKNSIRQAAEGWVRMPPLICGTTVDG